MHSDGIQRGTVSIEVRGAERFGWRWRACAPRSSFLPLTGSLFAFRYSQRAPVSKRTQHWRGTQSTQAQWSARPPTHPMCMHAQANPPARGHAGACMQSGVAQAPSQVAAHTRRGTAAGNSAPSAVGASVSTDCQCDGARANRTRLRRPVKPHGALCCDWRAQASHRKLPGSRACAHSHALYAVATWQQNCCDVCMPLQ